MPRANIVDITSQISSAVRAAQGFGLLIVGQNAPTGGAYASILQKLYATQAEMLVDLWSTSDAEYLALGVALAQERHVGSIRVGVVTPVAQVATIVVDTATTGTYTVVINGVSYTYSATVPSDSAGDIRDALVTAINAGTEPVTAAPVTGVTLTLTADNAGEPFVASLSGTRAADMTLTATTANYGYSEGLAAIYAESTDWWGVYCVDDDDWHLLEVAKGLAALDWGFALQDTASAGVLADTAGNIGETLHDAGYSRIGLIYHATPSQYAGVAVLSSRLATDPDVESTTWNGAKLTGVTVDDSLTTAQQSNLEANAVGYYMTHGAQGATMFVRQASGGDDSGFVDNLLASDWFEVRTAEQHIADAQAVANRGGKLGYTDEGIAVYEQGARAIYEQGKKAGHIARDVEVAAADVAVFSFPTRATALSADIAARRYRYAYSCPLAGGIERVTGVITLVV